MMTGFLQGCGWCRGRGEDHDQAGGQDNVKTFDLMDCVKADGKSICVESLETSQGKSIR